MLLRAVLLSTAAAAAVSQQKDWLVHRQDSKTRLLKTASGLKLTNGLIERSFATQPDGYFCTTDLRRGERSFFRALSPEANLTVNGHRYNIGGGLGPPDNRYEVWYAEQHLPIVNARRMGAVDVLIAAEGQVMLDKDTSWGNFRRSQKMLKK